MKAQPATTKNQLGCQSGHIPWRNWRRFVIFCTLFFSMLLSLPLHANDETSVEVSCIDSSSGIFVGEYTATFKAITKGKVLSYSWSTTEGEIVGSRSGSTIKLKVNVSDVFHPETGNVTCQCTFDKGKNERGSSHFSFPSEIPEVRLEISGQSLIEWEDVDKGTEFSYNAKGEVRTSNSSQPLGNVSWSISKGNAVGNIVGTSVDEKTNEGKAMVEFHTGGTCELTCSALVFGCEVSDTFKIQVKQQFVNFTVRRANYEVDKENKHINFLTGQERCYVHWNIDDDDWSCEEYNTLYPRQEKLGSDCMQKYFTGDYEDDDLCEIIIAPEDGAEVKNGILTFQVPKNYRLWSSKKRAEGSLLFNGDGIAKFDIDLSNNSKVKWDSKRGVTLYIECCEGHIGDRYLLIWYRGMPIGTYAYSSCSLGRICDQPTKFERQLYMQCFPGLIGCEWFVISRYDEIADDTLYYNCIDYAVDPRHNIIGREVWINAFLPKFDEKGNKTEFYQDKPVKKQWSFSEALYTTSSFDMKTLNLCRTVPVQLIVRLNWASYITMNYISMDQFSNNDRIFDDKGGKDDVFHFFLSGNWFLDSSCLISDLGAKVVYYSQIHAARALHDVWEYEYNQYRLTEWRTYASKCGQLGTIAHRMEQVETQCRTVSFEDGKNKLTGGYGFANRAYPVSK